MSTNNLLYANQSYVINFFNYIMDNFETELVVLGAKIALKTYKLPIEPSQLKNFNQFHKKYGKYIVEPN